jgi:predicted deacetylase
MDRLKWHLMEELFDRFEIKPIVAVIPENRDPNLCWEAHDEDFWEKVRSWQRKGWTIAMHGYQHLMHQTNTQLVLPFYRHSEFGGLSYEQQAEKIRYSWQIFLSENVIPTVWIAPAHCFDWLTLKAIQAETSIRIVSDGIAREQFYDKDFYWIPQQLWEFTNKRAGLWTVCLHPNTMTEQQIASLGHKIENIFCTKIIELGDVELKQRKKSIADHLEAFIFWRRHWKNNLIRQIKAIVYG